MAFSKRRISFHRSFAWTRVFWIAAACVLSACSGGGSGNSGGATTPAVPLVLPSSDVAPASDSKLTVPIRISYALVPPTTNGQDTQSKNRRVVQANSNYTGFTSNTPLPVTLTITVTPVGGTPLTPVSGTCTVAASQTSGSCNVALTAPVGPETIAGAITNGAGQAIATFSNVVVVQPNTANSINFTANPVVNSVALALAAATTYNGLPATNAGAASNTVVSVNAMDAAGNIIAGNASYVDAAGNPVAFFLSVTNTQAGGSGTVTLKGPPRILSPSSAVINAHYDGNWLQSSTISVASTSPLITSLTPATLATKPKIYEYPLAAASASIITGPDGNIWFTEPSLNALVKMSTSAGILGTYTNANSYDGSYTLAVGADGNLWAAESYSSNSIAKVSVNGALLGEYTIPTAAATVGGMTAGPDGNIWFTEYSTGRVGKVTPNGIFKEYSGVTQPENITTGPDGKLWLASYGDSNVQAISTAGIVSPSIPLPARGTSVVTGNDGNIWFTTTFNGAYIGYVTPGSSAATTFSTNNQSRGLVNGPDGNIWFADTNANKIGKAAINCSSSCVTEYASTTSGPFGITLGSDGNIWFTETGRYVGKFVL